MAAVSQSKGGEQERDVTFISINRNVLLILRSRKLESEGEVEAISSLSVPAQNSDLSKPFSVLLRRTEGITGRECSGTLAKLIL